jgi:hypothetical protein
MEKGCARGISCQDVIDCVVKVFTVDSRLKDRKMNLTSKKFGRSIKMKRIIIASLVIAMVVGIGIAFADKDVTGNGCPSGAHYNLNIIGVDNPKTAPMTGTSGHTIFVKLYGKTKINLALAPEGESFMVLDRNGTDGNGAKFQLPAVEDPENPGVTLYSVFARPLGKPNGKAKMRTGAWDPDIGEYVYSVCVLELERTKGKQRFENVSKELLYIYAYIYVGPGVDLIPGTEDDEYEFMRLPLFAPELEGYFWDYDNNGLKIVQLRFYEGLPTIVPDVVAIDPTSGPVDSDDYTITITGDNIALGGPSDTPTVEFDCDGIGDVQVTYVDNSTLSVTIDIASDALAGTYEVLVTRGDGTEFIGGFEVVVP